MSAAKDAGTTPGRASPGSGPQPPAGSVRVVIGSIAVLLLLSSLDQTIVSTALPTIVADLGGLEHLSWVVTAYILTSTIAAPLYGKLGDLYGRRNMVFTSVALFLLGSALCGMAGSMLFLIGARALQGLGGGGLFVLALSIVGDVIPPRERGRIQGLFAVVFSTSSVVGPLIGGLFVEHFSWRWIFYVNLPLGLVAVVGFSLAFRPTGRRLRHAIDYAGAAVLSLALAALVIVTSVGGVAFAWTSRPALALMVLAVAGFALFARIEARAAEPLLPLSLFRLNVFTVTSAIGFVAGAAMFGSITFMPLYLQIVKGVTPTVSGLQLVPMTLGIVFSSNLAGRYMERTGGYVVLTRVGMAGLCAGMLLLATIGAATPYALTGAYLAIVGFGMGFIFPVVTTAVQNAVPHSQLGTATAAGLMFRQVGGSLGVALFGALFAARMTAGLVGLPPEVAAQIGPEMLHGLDAAARAQVAGAVVAGLTPIFVIAALLGAIGLALTLLLKEVPLRGRATAPGE